MKRDMSEDNSYHRHKYRTARYVFGETYGNATDGSGLLTAGKFWNRDDDSETAVKL